MGGKCSGDRDQQDHLFSGRGRDEIQGKVKKFSWGPPGGQ